MHLALTKLASIEQAATKGPWEADERASGGDNVFGPNDERICDTYGDTSFEPYRSNQLLIVAARNALPALIAALVEIDQLCDDQTNYFPSASHNGALRYVQTIIQKHLEPLK